MSYAGYFARAAVSRVRLIRRAALAMLTILYFVPHPGFAACESRTGAADRWKVESHQDVSWLVTPCGERFFSVGVNTLTDTSSSPLRWNKKRKSWLPAYEVPNRWARGAARQLRGWGFNTSGAFSAANVPMNSLPDLDLGWRAQYNWVDPFDPGAEDRIAAQAKEAIVPYRGRPSRIGYFSDNEIGWWNGAMFRYYLKQPATSHTKQALIALMRRHYGDDWPRFSDDFAVPAGISSFSDLLDRPDSDAHLRPGGSGIKMVREWTAIIARRYYELINRALRAADPNALIFGDRLPSYYDPDAVRAMLPFVDAIATNYDVDSPDGWVAHYYFDSLAQLTGNKPVLVSEWYFAARENRSGNLNNGHLMSVQTQAERARGAASAALHFARVPGVIGVHWFQYRDEPKGGRKQDREDYNFGLLDTAGRPYEQLTAALTVANRRLPEIHRSSTRRADADRSKEIRLPEVAIDPNALALARWPKEEALIRGLSAPAPEVVFGDFFLGWSARGIHLATISMDHYDAHLLEYSGEFPRTEAFRIDFGADAGAGAHRFAFFVIPPKGFERHRGMAMRIESCSMKGGKCEPVPGASAVYQIGDRPRIVAQITLPWQVLGIDEPPSNGKLRIQLAATAFYRSHWMSLGGAPPAKAMNDTAGWRIATLIGRKMLFSAR